MIVYKVDDSYLEVEVTDLRAKVRIAEACEGIDVTGCKVIVIFIRGALDSGETHTNFPEGEDSRPRGAYLIELFEAQNP